MPKRLKLSLNSECCLWYDGKRGRRGDSKLLNQPVTFESNRDVRFKFELNLEASQVTNIYVYCVWCGFGKVPVSAFTELI